MEKTKEPGRKRRWLVLASVFVVLSTLWLAYGRFVRHSPLAFDATSMAVPSDWKTFEGQGWLLQYPPHFAPRSLTSDVVELGNGRWRITFSLIGASGETGGFRPVDIPIDPTAIPMQSLTGHPPNNRFFSYTFSAGVVAVPVGSQMYALRVEFYPDTVEGDRLVAARIISSFRAT